MGKVFLSYRRKDSQGSTGRLYDLLADTLSGHQIFMDVDGIEPGENFVRKLRATLPQCDAVLVVVGSQWLAGENGRRLREPGDHVCMEVELALETKGLCVIPVFVDEATVVPRKKLPPALQTLFDLNAFTLRHDGFRDDASELTKFLKQILDDGDARRAGKILERDRDDVKLARQTAVDLSEHVEIHDTGRTNDCVAHAAACALQASMRGKGREVFVDVGNMRKQIEYHDRIKKKGEGTFMTTPIYVIEQFGVELLSNRPAWLPPLRGPQPARRTMLNIVRRITGSFFRLDDYWRIPLELKRGRPIFACIKGYQSFVECSKGRVKAPADGEEFTFGHAFVIVGWTGKAVRFANNQGVAWGDGGYGTMDHPVAQKLLFLDQMWAIEADPRGELAAELTEHERLNPHLVAKRTAPPKNKRAAVEPPKRSTAKKSPGTRQARRPPGVR